MVLNWNGAANLRRFLPAVLAAAEVANADVWVVDNNSDDESARVCSREFPHVRFERLPTNRSLASYNIAAARSQADVFVSLDNDVLVDLNFLPPLLDHFTRREDVFAVSSWIKGFPPDSCEDPGAATSVEWRRGMLRGRSTQPTEGSMPVFYNCGCATAFDRRKFLMLGGFDALFFPLYYEDTDLSWRAWKRGWLCLYEPKSIVYHEGGGALGRSQAVTTLVLRNEFLFHWKNVSDPRLVASHVASTVPRLLAAAARRDTARLKGFAGALPYLPRALRRRRLSREHRRITDNEAIKRINAKPWRVRI
jgi:GT2 family glycosyltransferase